MPTQAQIAEVNRPTSGVALLAFLVLSHPALPGGVLRYVTDVLPYIWGGDRFDPIGGIEIPLVDDGESGPQLRITIPNIDRRVGQFLRSASGRIRIDQFLLSTEDFDLSVNPRTEVGTASAVYAMTNFELVEGLADALAADLTIQLRDYSQAQFGVYATQSLLPGLRR